MSNQLYVQVIDGKPYGSAQTLPYVPAGWYPFEKLDEEHDWRTQRKEKYFDADAGVVKQKISWCENPNAVLLKALRGKRNTLLSQCDWTEMASSPLTVNKRQEWEVYRQALRDLPAAHTDTVLMADITFPTKPT
tara:strand:+ start:297 stop:698 length:402 start_codon:yes stop_codon:yes gene_type:complete